MNIRDNIFSICSNLNINDLINFSQVDKFINKICNEDKIWVKFLSFIPDYLKKIYLNESNKSLIKKYNLIVRFIKKNKDFLENILFSNTPEGENKKEHSMEEYLIKLVNLKELGTWEGR